MYTLNHIKQVYIGKNKLTNYLVIEDNNNTIVLNINKGIEENNLNISLSNIVYIYDQGNEYQEEVELNTINRVLMYLGAEIINKNTKKTISSPFLVCIEDITKKRIYIDLSTNATYTRKDSYRLKTYSNTQTRRLYIKDKKILLGTNKIHIKICRKLDYILDLDEENIT
ncbi:MAG: hypothetical protein IKH54_00125 [Bacilli bacterium]|nr:hypothetical protein [Bacilli bacterium]